MNVNQTLTRLLRPEFVHADLLVILALQETTSSDGEEMHLTGFVLYGNESRSTTLIVLDRLCHVQRTWRSEERWTAFLLVSAMVMCIFAPDSGKRPGGIFSMKDDKEEPNVCKLQATSTSSWVCYVLAMGEDENLFAMYGQQCWQGLGPFLGDVKKMMGYDIMLEIKCKVISTRSSCDDRKAMVDMFFAC